MKRNSAKNITILGLFVAFVCVISAIPLGFNILGVAATLQTFAISFAGFVLGWKKGAATAALYVLIGLILPVYSNMTSGPGILFGPTGGFLWGFIPMAVLCGVSVKVKNMVVKAAVLVSSVMVCHILGLLQFAIVTGSELIGSLMAVTLPYLPKDLVMVSLAWMVAQPVRKSARAYGLKL